MQKKPLISATVAIFNLEKEIIPFLISLKKQSFHDIEVFLIDDCSTDQTNQIISNYLSQNKFNFPVILIKNETNLGLGLTRRAHLENITGEYLVQLDGDDQLNPDFFESLANSTEYNPDIIVADYAESLAELNHNKSYKFEIIEGFENFSNIHFYVPRGIWRHAIKTRIAKSAYKELSNIVVDLGEDMVFLSKVYLIAHNFLFIEKKIIYYHRRHYSLTDYDKLNTQKLNNFFQAHVFVNNIWSNHYLQQFYFNILTAAFKVKFINILKPEVYTKEIYNYLYQFGTIYSQYQKNIKLINFLKKQIENKDYGFHENLEILSSYCQENKR